MYIIVVILVLIIACIVTAILFNNHNMKLKWEEATNTDIKLIREAIEYSQRGCNMTNPVLALVEVTSAKVTMDSLIKRYGIQMADNITGQDTGSIYDTLTRQHDRIMRDICKNYPEMVPKGELKSYKNLVKERDESRDDDVPHMDFEEYDEK